MWMNIPAVRYFMEIFFLGKIKKGSVAYTGAPRNPAYGPEGERTSPGIFLFHV
jgi:hypothetical protein